MIFRIIYLALWIVFSLIRFPYAKKHKHSKKIKTVRPGIERFLVFINFIGMGLLPLFFVIVPTPNVLVIHLPGWAVICSVIILALSLALFHFIHKSLGNNWSPILEIQEEHQLIKSGIYKSIRHPMYTQIWIWVIFQGLVLQNWLVEVYGVVAWLILYVIRVPEEEKMLIDEFGDEYKEYISQTGRVFPKLFADKKGSNITPS